MDIFIISMKDNDHPTWSNEVIQTGFKTREKAQEEIWKQKDFDIKKGLDFSYFVTKVTIED